MDDGYLLHMYFLYGGFTTDDFLFLVDYKLFSDTCISSELRVSIKTKGHLTQYIFQVFFPKNPFSREAIANTTRRRLSSEKTVIIIILLLIKQTDIANNKVHFFHFRRFFKFRAHVFQ